MRPSRTIREGDDYYVCWDELRLALHFTRVRETDSAIRTLVTPVVMPGRTRILAPMMVNLFTKADRERMADAIRERLDGQDDSRGDRQYWRDSIEEAFAAMLDAHTQPVAAMDLSTHAEVPDEPELVWPILARNQVNVWLADQASGKSYSALLIAAIIASGRHDLLPAPLRCDISGPVIYCDSETDDTVQWRRLCRVAAGLHLPRLPQVHYLHIDPPFTSEAPRIRAEVARLGAVFTVVDSLTFATGGNLNDTELSVPTMNAIGDLGPECTKLAIAHHGKAGRTEGATPSVIGSAGFEFKARNIWIIRVESEPGASNIVQAWTHKKANDSGLRPGFGLSLDFNDSNTAVTFRSVGVTSSDFVARHAGTERDRVLAAIVGTPLMKADTKAIARDTGISEQHVARATRELVTRGAIRLVQGGRGRGLSVFEAVDQERSEAESEIANRQSSTEISHQSDLTNEIANSNSPYRKNELAICQIDGNSQLAENEIAEIANGYLEPEDEYGWAGAR